MGSAVACLLWFLGGFRRLAQCGLVGFCVNHWIFLCFCCFSLFICVYGRVGWWKLWGKGMGVFWTSEIFCLLLGSLVAKCRFAWFRFNSFFVSHVGFWYGLSRAVSFTSFVCFSFWIAFFFYPEETGKRNEKNTAWNLMFA